MSFQVRFLLILWLQTAVFGTIRINEFMAANRGTLVDEQEPDDYPDWIELYNPDGREADLKGWFITDNPFQPTKWRLPEGVRIAAKGYLVLLADGEPQQGALHLGFKLKSEAGFIGLAGTDGIGFVDSISYGNQTPDISYGRSPDGAQWLYQTAPTPGKPNAAGGFLGLLGKVMFSRPHGFCYEPFDLALSADPPQAEILYTLDGSRPQQQAGGSTLRYVKPIRIVTTTAVRAHAVLAGWKESGSVTQTYIFPKDVIRQPKNPPGFPQNWGLRGTGDYEMDSRVVDHPRYRGEIIDDLLSIPSLSLVMPIDDWFGEGGRGIYVQGELDERFCSAELIWPNGSEGFQINCGVMIVGGTSPDRWKIDKLSMRLKFKSEYGESKLRYPFFGAEATDEFNTLVVDARCNNTWAYGGSVRVQGRDLRQNDIAQYTRDPFVAELQKAAGGLAPNGRQVHLYLNGLYWGMYWVHERPDEHFAAAYRGGRPEDYDVIKHNSNTLVSGSLEAYKRMFAVANSSRSIEEKYALLEEMLDLPDFINYIIINFYVGNWDWAHQNWYATRAKSGRESKWRYHSWDAEHVMEAIEADVTGKIDDGGPTRLHQVLKDHPAYRRRFADQVYLLLFNDGILSTERVKAFYSRMAEEVYRPIVCESARWGDSRRDTPYTRDVEWIRERDWLLNEYFPQRRDVVIRRLRSQGLYPNIEPPRLLLNGKETTGGKISKGAALTIESGSPVFFTTDGSDPVIEGHTRTVTLIPSSAPKRILVPTVNPGIRWRSDVDYDDSQWYNGIGGVGYDLNATYRPYISVDIQNLMYDANGGKPTLCYIRIPFKLSADQVKAVKKLHLILRYDDGFVAYLNGAVAASANAPAIPAWNAAALADREAEAEEVFDISSLIGRLRAGDNLLAVHGMNVNAGSSDFLITVELCAHEGEESTLSSSAERYDRPIVLEGTTALAARATVGMEWSPLRRALFAIPGSLADLRITEIHYQPLPDGATDGRAFEFIELKNIGSRSLDLAFSRFCAGVRFTFPVNARLAPQEFYVIAGDAEQFARRYGALPDGIFEGSLDNAGESLVLVDAAGDTIIDLRYNDKSPWPDEAAGTGRSLVAKAVNPSGDPSRAEYWAASFLVHGSPRRDDRKATSAKDFHNNRLTFALQQNFSNPFNAATIIRFTLPVEQEVKLEVFNLLGQKTAVLIDGRVAAGDHAVTFDGSEYSAGVYFYRLQAGVFQQVRKMTIVK